MQFSLAALVWTEHHNIYQILHHPYLPKMMLKVEAYAAGSDEPVQPVLHICLATADPETGVCLSVGRKEGLVRFEHDKSVSRRDHCLLRFVSSTESAFPCQNPEQSDAVDSMHNLAVVLQNQGKLGSVLIHEPEKQLDKKEKPSPGKDDDSATLDSAATMDDVDAGPLTGNTSSLVSSAGPPGAALSQAAIRLLGSDMVDQVRLDVLGTEQTRVLSPLSLPNGRIIVQCGKLGSTIVITRLDTLTFVRSGFGSKKILPWLKKLHWIGAHEVTPWSTNSIHSTNDSDAEAGAFVQAIGCMVSPCSHCGTILFRVSIRTKGSISSVAQSPRSRGC